MNLITILALVFAFSAYGNELKLNRYIAIETCYEDGECVGPAAKNIEKSSIEFDMQPYAKAGDRGITASDLQIVQEGKTLFKSEIRLVKKEKTDFYYVYMKLKSGLSRNGKVTIAKVKDLKNFKQRILLDEPIKTKNGTLQAQLIVGPVVPLSK